MTAVLTTVGSAAHDPADRAMRKLAEFMGLTCQAAGVGEIGTGEAVMIMTGDTLKTLLAPGQPQEAKRRPLPRGKLLVRGFSSEDASCLTELTDGALSGVRPAPPGLRTYAFEEAFERRLVTMAGLARAIEETRELAVFVPSRTDSRMTVLVTVDRQPLLVRFRLGDTEVFLLSEGALPDLDQVCESEADVLAASIALLPAAIFLRLAFGAACWSNPFPAANLVIDDPMLRQRYGFVEYHRLMAEAAAHGFAVTIAFIPFNHRRSDRRTVEFLRGHNARFSIAVHGCDHSGGEFGALGAERLRHISELAMARMRRHEARYGMPFDPVMVFPQGFFSAPAFDALKRSGYEAVVNTELFPKHGDKPKIALRQFLDGAIMAYAGVPLFSRRYPKSAFDFATDLFWGKPVLLVEHHGYFAQGYPHLAAFVGELGRLAENLEWKPLGEVVTRHALYRSAGAGRTAARFFTPTFRLRNSAASAIGFALEKPETEPDLIEQVTVEGRPVAWRIADGALRIELDLPASGEVTVRVCYREIPAPAYRLPLRYRFSVAARRYLSEFRDNHLARNPRLLAAATGLKALLRGKR